MWFVCKMLLTFFTVIAVDLVAVSLLTHKLRVWFPVWFDAHWATRTDPWVVYSQSYFAGLFFIPLLSVSLDRHVLRGRPGWVRPVFWIVAIGAFLFILGWKGELMVRFGKQWEALGWLKELAILGASGYGIETVDGARDHAFRLYLDLAARRRVEPGSLVTHTMPMQDFRQGFRSAREKATYASIKVLLEPSPSRVAGGTT